MHDDLRPRPHEYRNVRRGLLEAFAAVYADSRQARRAFAAALEARGRMSALLLLRTVPERFGAPLADADARARDFADEAADSFALCRERCTRPLVRDGARLLRTVHAARSREQRLSAARSRANLIAREIADAKELHRDTEAARAKLVARAPRVYIQPERAVEAVIRFSREHDENVFYLAFDHRWKPAGRLRRSYRKDWLGWLGFTDEREANRHLGIFHREATQLIRLLRQAPEGAEWMADKMAEQEAANAEFAAIEAERVPVLDPARALRQAAQVLFDAMRLLERRPSDAVPHLSRQLAPMLPPDAHPLIAEVLKMAARYDDDRKPGNGRERGPRRYDR